MKKLKELRNKLKLTQTEVAEKLGLKQTTYSHYEIDNAEPDIATLIKLADFFKVPIDALVERKFNNIDFSKFTDIHFILLEKISSLNETQCEKLIGYLDGMSNK